MPSTDYSLLGYKVMMGKHKLENYIIWTIPRNAKHTLKDMYADGWARRFIVNCYSCQDTDFKHNFENKLMDKYYPKNIYYIYDNFL